MFYVTNSILYHYIELSQACQQMVIIFRMKFLLKISGHTWHKWHKSANCTTMTSLLIWISKMFQFQHSWQLDNRSTATSTSRCHVCVAAERHRQYLSDGWRTRWAQDVYCSPSEGQSRWFDSEGVRHRFMNCHLVSSDIWTTQSLYYTTRIGKSFRYHISSFILILSILFIEVSTNRNAAWSFDVWGVRRLGVHRLLRRSGASGRETARGGSGLARGGEIWSQALNLVIQVDDEVWEILWCLNYVLFVWLCLTLWDLGYVSRSFVGGDGSLSGHFQAA